MSVNTLTNLPYSKVFPRTLLKTNVYTRPTLDNAPLWHNLNQTWIYGYRGVKHCAT